MKLSALISSHDFKELKREETLNYKFEFQITDI